MFSAENQNMRKFVCRLAILFLLTLAITPIYAQQDDDSYTYSKLIISLPGTGAPYIKDGYVVFTAELGPRNIGIAFDFENYSVVHPFKIRRTYDMDENLTGSLFFYAFEIPERMLELSYRLVIDGLWTYDPLNPDTHFDNKIGVTVSHVFIADSFQQETEPVNKNKVRFIYEGKQGQIVKLTGTFTNWDPWIYELQETRPGFYEISLNLPPGTYYYNYMIGMTPILDKTNSSRAYTRDGRRASMIVVE